MIVFNEIDKSSGKHVRDVEAIDISEVAAIVGRSKSSVRNMVAEGRFPQHYCRCGGRHMWELAEVKRWMQK